MDEETKEKLSTWIDAVEKTLKAHANTLRELLDGMLLNQSRVSDMERRIAKLEHQNDVIPEFCEPAPVSPGGRPDDEPL